MSMVKKISESSPAQDKATSIMVLPVDIMVIIFLKFLVNPLFLCRCVCKHWRNIIDSSSFADKYRTMCSYATQSRLILFRYSHESPTMKVYAINPQLLSSNTLTVSQRPIDEFRVYKNKQIESLGYGLFLVKGNEYLKEPSFLYNPLRGEKLILPLVERKEDEKGALTFRTHGLAFNYSSKQYKLVRVTEFSYCCHPRRPNKLVAQVYTLGSDEWKKIAVPPRWNTYMQAGTPAYGDIHWYDQNCSIVSFMVTTEEFKVTPVPHLIRPSVPDLIANLIHPSCYLFNWKEDLAVLDTSLGSNTNMWVLRDYEKKRWEKLYTIHWEEDISITNITNMGTWEEDIVFTTSMNNENEAYCCNPERGHITDITRLLGNGGQAALHPFSINLDSLASYGIVASTRSQKENQEDA